VCSVVTSTYATLTFRERLAHVQIPASLLAPKNPAQANPATSPQASTAPLPTVSVSKEQKKKYKLSTETDPLFGELRDLNFSAVGKRLSKTAHQLNENYNVRVFDEREHQNGLT
jgi:vacuolar protein sorting-associated protein 33A